MLLYAAMYAAEIDSLLAYYLIIYLLHIRTRGTKKETYSMLCSIFPFMYLE